MLDVVVCAMVAVAAVLAYSVYLVRYRRDFVLHRKIQIALAVILGIAVFAFEIDIRFFTDWRANAEPSPYFANGAVYLALWVHLSFAIPTPFIWGVVIAAAIRYFKPLEPGEHSGFHRFWGRVAVVWMLLTAITGWIFYWLAFVAR